MKRYKCKFSCVSFYVEMEDGSQRLVEFYSPTNRGQGSTLSIKDEALQKALEKSEYYKCGIISIIPQEEIVRRVDGTPIVRVNIDPNDVERKMTELEGLLNETPPPVMDNTGNIPAAPSPKSHEDMKVVFDEPVIPADVLKRKGSSEPKPVASK